MNSVTAQLSLQSLAQIAAGYPFRGSINELPLGNVAVIQMAEVGSVEGVDWTRLPKVALPSGRAVNFLEAGDVIFTTRGARNYAVALETVRAPAVCSPQLFVIRVDDRQILAPTFLAWQINQQPGQRYLRKGAEGSNQLSIRRQILAAMPFTVPPIRQQHQAVELARLALRERTIHEALLQNRERHLRMIANRLLEID